MKTPACISKKFLEKKLCFAICSILLAAPGCGGGFDSASAPASCVGTACDSANDGAGDTEPNPGGDPGTDPGSTAAWKNLQLQGAISGGRYAQTPVIGIDKQKKLLKLKLPMPPNPFLIFTRDIQLPELPGASLSMEALPDGSMAVVLNLPLEKLLRGLEFPRKDKLPNGEDLPGIAGGELPSFSVSLVPPRKTKATIYLGPSVVAVFVPTDFDPVIRTPAIPIRDQTMTRTLGYFAIIPAVGSNDGGFYISAALPSDIARIIDDIL